MAFTVVSLTIETFAVDSLILLLPSRLTPNIYDLRGLLPRNYDCAVDSIIIMVFTADSLIINTFAVDSLIIMTFAVDSLMMMTIVVDRALDIKNLSRSVHSSFHPFVHSLIHSRRKWSNE